MGRGAIFNIFPGCCDADKNYTPEANAQQKASTEANESNELLIKAFRDSFNWEMVR